MSDVGSETPEKLPGPPFTIAVYSHLEFLFSKVHAVLLPSETEDKVLGFGLGRKSLEEILPLSALIMDFLSKLSL